MLMSLKEEYSIHRKEIESRLQEFSKLKSEEHVKELFFCILTPQSNAEKCWHAVLELENCKDKKKIEQCLKTKTRFYRNKTRYLIEANKNWETVKELINSNQNPIETRNWIADNIKGLGMKEASHFMRNIGASKNQLAILDRHILRQLKKLNVIEEDKIKNNRDYLKKEQLMKKFSKQVNIPQDHLDLLFWKIESGRIFK